MFENIVSTLESLGLGVIPVFRTALIVIVLFLLFSFILGIIRRVLLKNVKSKKQKSNVKIFSSIFKFGFLITIVIVAIFSYGGSLTGFGIVAGLASAALGWALQRPITGIAAWIMVILRRPFDIGDRIVVGGVKGDVRDITLTHVYLDEIGGLINAEDNSGRIVMIPNYLLFEEKIINYTLQHDFVLTEAIVQVTYESDLEKAMDILKKAGEKYAGEFTKKAGNEIKVRIEMAGSGIDIKVRFFAPAVALQKTKTLVLQDVYNTISKDKTIEIAYPHTEIVFKNKKLFDGNKK
jgi:small-conductance mechanosensitive channel